jgi:uncharacterized protein (DUF1330 family)
LAKAYWIACYKKIADMNKWNAYADHALPAIKAGGGVFLARGLAAHAYDAGIKERTIVIEFPNLMAALATFDSAGYQAGLVALGDGAVRDLRIVEGL